MIGIFIFFAKTQHQIPEYRTFPIYDEYGALVGGFSSYTSDTVRCSISGKGYPCAIKISADGIFYFGIIQKGQEFQGIVSENKTDESQSLVSLATPV
jgi:hypothetical protein